MERSKIKGNVLLARLRFLRERGGEPLLRQILQRLSPGDRAVLGGILLPVSWYPLELNLRLDQAIADVLAGGSRDKIFLEMGRASADANLTGVHRFFVKPGNPHYLLSHAPQIYRFYYAVGHRTYEKTGEGAVLRTYEAEDVTATDCLTVVGWHERAIELSGGKGVRVVEALCRARGDAICEYRCSWT
jgi:uncharacterized protein (TIGR02265 family)